MEGIHPLVIVGRGGIVMELGELGRGEHLGRIGHHTCIWCPYQLTLVEGRGMGEGRKERKGRSVMPWQQWTARLQPRFKLRNYCYSFD